jgi:hypothetical protein
MYLTILLTPGQVYPADGDEKGFKASWAWTSTVTSIYPAGVPKGLRPRSWYDQG